MPEERIFPRKGFGFRTIRGFRNDHTARTGILRPGAKQFALSEITVYYTHLTLPTTERV